MINNLQDQNGKKYTSTFSFHLSKNRNHQSLSSISKERDRQIDIRTEPRVCNLKWKSGHENRHGEESVKQTPPLSFSRYVSLPMGRDSAARVWPPRASIHERDKRGEWENFGRRFWRRGGEGESGKSVLTLPSHSTRGSRINHAGRRGVAESPPPFGERAALCPARKL